MLRVNLVIPVFLTVEPLSVITTPLAIDATLSHFFFLTL
jgi:hypothetical protein